MSGDEEILWDHNPLSVGEAGVGAVSAECAEPKHTPGPWRTFDGNPSKIEIICGDCPAPGRWPSAGIRVAEIRFKRIGRGGAFGGNAVDAANARLIAAAPDMLAALQRALQAHTQNRTLSVGEWTDIYRAIVKARGRP